ncbi:MAG: hypothetical protein FIB08_09310 [Candidatus Methanoperedens sp.]|nr:hypothetical protein [Candidatus Methanoperedens sp.]
MDDFLDKLKTVRAGFFKKMRFLFILDLIIITSISYAAFIILNLQFFLEKSFPNPPIPLGIIPPAVSLVIALIGALLLHRKDKKKNVTLLIENKYPELNERLRTACDNRDESNVIVESLKSYVSEMLGKVSASQLFSKRRIAAKIILTIVFIVAAVAILITPEARIPPNDVENFMNTVGGNLGNVTNETLNPFADANMEENKAGNTGSGEIFGKPNIAPVEGKPVDLTLQVGGGLGNVPKDYDPSQNQFIKSGAFPVDVLGSNVSDGGYSTLMKKSETEKELINKYAIERSKI